MFTKKPAFKLILGIIIIAVIYFANYNPELPVADNNLVVRFVDVGQGDCEIVQFPDGRNIIIDGGTNETSSELVNAIKSYGIKRFDYVVATHPHEDHIGGLDDVIKSFEIGNVYLPDTSSSSMSFKNLVESISQSGAKVNRAYAGVTMIDETDIRAEFLAPVNNYYEDENNYSSVLKLTYKGFSFLFTGDAETISEYDMIENGAYLKSDVLKVGHHGSTTSTSNQFLRAVNPAVAVISVGHDNSYGHPHREILERLSDLKLYRTDLNGTVTVFCDGESLSVSTEK